MTDRGDAAEKKSAQEDSEYSNESDNGDGVTLKRQPGQLVATRKAPLDDANSPIVKQEWQKST